jgi:hypothetical protein
MTQSTEFEAKAGVATDIALCFICGGDGTVCDGLDEAACSYNCPNCDGAGFIVGESTLAAIEQLQAALLSERARADKAEAELAEERAANVALKDLCLAAGDLYKGGGVFPMKGAMALRLLKAGALIQQVKSAAPATGLEGETGGE